MGKPARQEELEGAAIAGGVALTLTCRFLRENEGNAKSLREGESSHWPNMTPQPSD